MNALIHRLYPLGIRLQLMLWYTAVFAALLLFTGAFFYQHLEHSLEASLDTTLQVRTADRRRHYACRWHDHRA